jgi:hypothetical protein
MSFFGAAPSLEIVHAVILSEAKDLSIPSLPPNGWQHGIAEDFCCELPRHTTLGCIER